MCFKHYTKGEETLLTNTKLSNEILAKMLDRTVQSVYHKRWRMKLNKGKSYSKPVSIVKAKDKKVSVPTMIAKKSGDLSVQQIVLGNVTIDMISKTLTIKF